MKLSLSRMLTFRHFNCAVNGKTKQEKITQNEALSKILNRENEVKWETKQGNILKVFLTSSSSYNNYPNFHANKNNEIGIWRCEAFTMHSKIP